MTKSITHDALVRAALTFHRYVGADLRDVRQYIAWYGKKKSGVKENRAALKRLEQAGDVRQVGEHFFLTTQGAKGAKGEALHAKWKSEDSWILLAISFGNDDEGIELSRLISAADYIDRAIPSLEQLHGALNRLASAQLITRRRGHFFLKERGRALVDKAKACGGRGAQREHRALSDLFECPCCGVTLKKVRWAIALDQATVDEAYQRYRKRMA